jgi:hypothetical protein
MCPRWPKKKSGKSGKVKPEAGDDRIRSGRRGAAGHRSGGKNSRYSAKCPPEGGFGFADSGGLPAAGASIIDHGQTRCATCMIPNLARVVFSRYLRRPIGLPHVKHSVFGSWRRSKPQRGSAVAKPLQRAQSHLRRSAIAIGAAVNTQAAAFAEPAFVVAAIGCSGANEFVAAWVRADRLAIFIEFRPHLIFLSRRTLQRVRG